MAADCCDDVASTEDGCICNFAWPVSSHFICVRLPNFHVILSVQICLWQALAGGNQVACLADIVKLAGEVSSMVLQLKTLPYGATESDS